MCISQLCSYILPCGFSTSTQHPNSWEIKKNATIFCMFFDYERMLEEWAGGGVWWGVCEVKKK